MKFFPIETRKWIEGKGYKKDVLLRDDELLCPGALVQLLTTYPKTSVSSHYHDEGMEVFHITGGRGIIFIEGKTFELKKGDTLTCCPKEVHGAENPYDEPFEYIVFKTNWRDDDSTWIE